MLWLVKGREQVIGQAEVTLEPKQAAPQLVRSASLAGQVRFFLKGLDPFFELYASPVNMDPMAPAMPLSSPSQYAAELAYPAGIGAQT